MRGQLNCPRDFFGEGDRKESPNRHHYAPPLAAKTNRRRVWGTRRCVVYLNIDLRLARIEGLVVVPVTVRGMP